MRGNNLCRLRVIGPPLILPLNPSSPLGRLRHSSAGRFFIDFCWICWSSSALPSLYLAEDFSILWRTQRGQGFVDRLNGEEDEEIMKAFLGPISASPLYLFFIFSKIKIWDFLLVSYIGYLLSNQIMKIWNFQHYSCYVMTILWKSKCFLLELIKKIKVPNFYFPDKTPFLYLYFSG